MTSQIINKWKGILGHEKAKVKKSKKQKSVVVVDSAAAKSSGVDVKSHTTDTTKAYTAIMKVKVQVVQMAEVLLLTTLQKAWGNALSSTTRTGKKPKQNLFPHTQKLKVWRWVQREAKQRTGRYTHRGKQLPAKCTGRRVPEQREFPGTVLKIKTELGTKRSYAIRKTLSSDVLDPRKFESMKSWHRAFQWWWKRGKCSRKAPCQS